MKTWLFSMGGPCRSKKNDLSCLKEKMRNYKRRLRSTKIKREIPSKTPNSCILHWKNRKIFAKLKNEKLHK